MTYNEFINNIIETRGQWNIPEGEYYEAHHIIPKCMGGEPNNISVHKLKHINIIWLYPQEHYEAHRLLALENPDNFNLVNSWWVMSTVKNDHQFRYIISKEEYAELKEHYSKVASERFLGENNPMYGKNAFEGKSEEELKMIYDKKSNSLTGIKRTLEQKLHYRESKLGNKNPMYGKHGKDNPRCKKVKCKETSEIFYSLKEAAEKVNGSSGGICSSCKYGYKSFGYHWEYI